MSNLPTVYQVDFTPWSDLILRKYQKYNEQNLIFFELFEKILNDM